MKWVIFAAVFALMGCASAKKQNTPASQASTPTSAAAQSSSRTTANATATASEGGKLSCTKDGEGRQLEVAKVGGGCALNYTKAGKMSSVASSTHGTKHCVSAEDKIRKKLEKAGFTCGSGL